VTRGFLVGLPQQDALVEAVLPDGRVHAARVVAVDEMVLTIAATRMSAGVAPPHPGDVLTLRWSGRRGRCAAPARLLAVDPVQFATWTLEAVGTVEIEQRRRFVRAAGSGQVRLEPADAGAAAPGIDMVVVGQLVDIGEGGMRCRLAAGGLDPSQPVYVRLLLDDRLLTLTGTVLRLAGTGTGAGAGSPAGTGAGAGPGARAGAGREAPAVEAVVEFDVDSTTAQAIRRYVLNRQRLERAVQDDVAS